MWILPMAKRCRDKILRIEFRGVTLKPSMADYPMQLAQLRKMLEAGELQPERAQETIPDTVSRREVPDDLVSLLRVWEGLDDSEPL